MEKQKKNQQQNKNNSNDQKDSDKQSDQQDNLINGYQVQQIIGRGSFGIVVKVIKNQDVFALKMIDKQIINEKNLYQYVQNEIQVMLQLKNSNIVKLYEFFQDNTFYYLVLEYCNQGTLYDYILTNRPDIKSCLQIFAQLLRGFRDIHEKGFLHRDLKPDNIYIRNNQFKIADFGLSKPSKIGYTYCGTPNFMAPEIFQRQKHDYKVDLWSLGVVLYFMIFNVYPFEPKIVMLEEIKNKTEPSFDLMKIISLKKNKQNQQQKHKFNQDNVSKITQELVDLFKKIFVFNPKQRITFQDLYELSIFDDVIDNLERSSSKYLYSQIEKGSPVNSTIVQNNKNSKFIHKKRGSRRESSFVIDQGSVKEVNKIKNRKSLKIQVSTIQINETLMIAEDDEGLQEKSIHKLQVNTKPQFFQSSFGPKLDIYNPQTFQIQGDAPISNLHQTPSSNDLHSCKLIQDNPQPKFEFGERQKLGQSPLKIVSQKKKDIGSVASIENIFQHEIDDDEDDDDDDDDDDDQEEEGDQDQEQDEEDKKSKDNGTNKSKNTNQKKNWQQQQQQQQQPKSNGSNNKEETKSSNFQQQNNNKHDDNSLSADLEEINEEYEESEKNLFFNKKSVASQAAIQNIYQQNYQKLFCKQDQKFSEQIKKYLQELDRQYFLHEIIEELKNVSISYNFRALLNYLLNKIMIFYAQRVYFSLHQKANLLGINNWTDFLSTQSAKEICKQEEENLKTWNSQLRQYFNQIDIEQDIKNKDLQVIITQTVQERDYVKQIQTPFRQVLNQLVLALIEYSKQKQQLNNSEIIDLLILQYKIFICMFLHQIFNENKHKLFFPKFFEKNETFSFFSFNEWIEQLSIDELQQENNYIVKLGFGNSSQIQILTVQQ